MSTQKGNLSRTRKQKHQNTNGFKNNLHGDTPKTKILNKIQICNVCAHCKDVLEWKIKFNKYKMLTAPAKCTKCLQKAVKQAYTILCQPCAETMGVCAKCGKKEDIVLKPGPSQTEKAQMEAKFQLELKALPERKRRTFLRYLEKLEKSKEQEIAEDDSLGGKPKCNNWMEQAEKRLELLKLEVEKEHGDDEVDDDWNDSVDDDYDDNGFSDSDSSG